MCLLIFFSVQSTLQRQQNQPCNIFPSEAPVIPSAFDSNHEISIAATNSDTSDSEEVIQTSFLQVVQNWANAIKHICNDREKQCLYLALFDEKLVCVTIFFHEVMILIFSLRPSDQMTQTWSGC